MKYIYYKIYMFSLVLRKGANPELRASFAFMMIQIINLIVVEKVFLKFFGENYNIEQLSNGARIVIGIILASINYYLFISKDKHLAIIEKYKVESEKSKKLGNILVSVYILSSLLILIYVKFYL
jgi:hypothetical protein